MYIEYKDGEKYPAKNADIADSAEKFTDAGYVLKDSDLVVDIDCLEKEKIEKLLVTFDIKTQIVWTERGAHLYFDKPEGFRGAKSVIPLGFLIEYKHLKNTKSITIKRRGKMRTVENEGKRAILPEVFKPSKRFKDLLGMSEGEGRNDALFAHRKAIGHLKDWQLMVKYINQNVFADPLKDGEVETISRDMNIEAEKDGESVIADFVMKERKVVKFNQELYHSEDGVYITDEDKLRRIVFDFCIGKKTNYVDEVIKQMDYRAKIIPNNKTFDIKFTNGILRNGKFIEVDYRDFTPYSVDIEYVPDAEPVQIVDDYLKHLTDGDMEYQNRLMEILGHCLIVNKEFKRMVGKFFIFVGDGGNGKGTLLAVIRAILNSKNCSGLSIKNMCDERYLNVLQGKLANLGDDVQDEAINNEQMKMLKNISTCDFVEIRKLYKNSNSVELTPTLIFTSNHVLKSFEKGESYKRRVDWLPMYGKPKSKQKDFITKLTEGQALEYWVKLIIDGYFRIYKNGGFTDSAKLTEFNEAYHTDNNSAIEYVLDLDDDEVIGRRSPEVYKDYEVWAEENGYNVQSAKLFKNTILEIMQMDTVPKCISGKTARVYNRVKK